ncbi:CoA-transferase family III [Kipferlia bialata]|uniref:CoA-transferase family III n=1 Tax=Kipferlia bialata TaxID=797122 RepID=A0A9K3CWS2_9EUKA|nr:CoA-transferase family III [Kipferlia bialata]|eukprot:g4935.t1
MSVSPLSHLKVLDFSTLLPGPYCSMMLADMGADVLRVESIDRVDLIREMEPMSETGGSVYHETLNRNKQSLALNLKHPVAVDIVHRLVEDYDIVLEQFRPDVMDRLGLGYEALSGVNPSLIYCSITGYGQTGPFKHRAGHDINYLSLAGVMSYGSEARPALLGTQIADIAGGSLHATSAILAAALGRDHTGTGCHLDVSMADCAYALNFFGGAAQLATDTAPQPADGLLNGGSHYGFYETKDGRYLSVGSLEPKFLAGLLSGLGIDPKRGMVTSSLASGSPLPSPQIASPFVMDGVKPQINKVGGSIGADTLSVVSGLGYSHADVEGMAADGVFSMKGLML